MRFRAQSGSFLQFSKLAGSVVKAAVVTGFGAPDQVKQPCIAAHGEGCEGVEVFSGVQ
jgi:hypothetical protein